jgi:hypothetical protein
VDKRVRRKEEEGLQFDINCLTMIKTGRERDLSRIGRSNASMPKEMKRLRSVLEMPPMGLTSALEQLIVGGVSIGFYTTKLVALTRIW